MANILRAALLSNAASRECARLGDRIVDVNHVFLGIVSSGGPAARAMASRGVDLTRARAGVRAVEEHVDPRDDDPDTDSIHVEDLHDDLQGELPWTDRAGRVFPTASSQHSDLSLLYALLTDESGIVPDLLTSLGVDTDELANELQWSSDAAEPAQDEDDVLPDDELIPEEATSATASMQYFLAQPLEQVWHAVSDPRAVVRWSGSPERSRVESGWIETTVDRFGTSGAIRLAPSLVEEPADGTARIVWQERHYSDKVDGEAGGYYDVRLHSADNGTAVDLVRAVRTFGRLGRALLPISRRTTAASLPGILQDIAYVSADTTPA